jgi:hypothetical protein
MIMALERRQIETLVLIGAMAKDHFGDFEKIAIADSPLHQEAGHQPPLQRSHIHSRTAHKSKGQAATSFMGGIFGRKRPQHR